MIKFQTKIPIYYGKLMVIINDKFTDSLRSIGVTADEKCDNYSGLAYDGIIKGVTHYVILLNTKPTHSIIAHEALHTTHNILKNICAKSDIDNDETTCYLLDWIIEQVYTALKKGNIEVIIK